MFLRKLASERQRNFPPRLIGVSALPCKTGNTKITSCHVNVVFSFVKQIRKTCPTEIRNVWHLLRYCSKYPVDCVRWISVTVVKDSHNWQMSYQTWWTPTVCISDAGCFVPCVGHVCCIQLIVSWMKDSLSVTRNYTDIAVRSLTTLRELTCHMVSHGYLPPDRGDIPAFIPAEAGTRLSDPGGMQG